jgi:hypothetical protein
MFLLVGRPIKFFNVVSVLLRVSKPLLYRRPEVALCKVLACYMLMPSVLVRALWPQEAWRQYQRQEEFVSGSAGLHSRKTLQRDRSLTGSLGVWTIGAVLTIFKV